MVEPLSDSFRAFARPLSPRRVKNPPAVMERRGLSVVFEDPSTRSMKIPTAILTTPEARANRYVLV